MNSFLAKVTESGGIDANSAGTVVQVVWSLSAADFVVSGNEHEVYNLGPSDVPESTIVNCHWDGPLAFFQYSKEGTAGAGSQDHLVISNGTDVSSYSYTWTGNLSKTYIFWHRAQLQTYYEHDTTSIECGMEMEVDDTWLSPNGHNMPPFHLNYCSWFQDYQGTWWPTYSYPGTLIGVFKPDSTGYGNLCTVKISASRAVKPYDGGAGGAQITACAHGYYCLG